MANPPVAIRGGQRRWNDTPPKHGNWGKDLPVVHRWAYDYSVPGAPEDFIPQNVPPDDRIPAGREHGVKS
jgi:hypothetical protein